VKQSPIFVRTYDLLRWLIPMTVKFPRQQRFVLAEAVQRTALRFQEALIEAARATDPLPLLYGADTDLTKLRFYPDNFNNNVGLRVVVSIALCAGR